MKTEQIEALALKNRHLSIKNSLLKEFFEINNQRIEFLEKGFFYGLIRVTEYNKLKSKASELKDLIFDVEITIQKIESTIKYT